MKKTIHSEAQNKFCALLCAARAKRKMTQTELAQRLKKPQSFVAKVENGERRMDVVEFVRYTDALGVNPEGLLRKLRATREAWNQ